MKIFTIILITSLFPISAWLGTLAGRGKINEYLGLGISALLGVLGAVLATRFL